MSTQAIPSTNQPIAITKTTISGKQTFFRAIKAEWLKLRSLRSTWISTLITVVLTVGLGAMVTIVYATNPSIQGDASLSAAPAWHFLTSGTMLGAIVIAVLGALLITSEYSSGQIRSSLCAVPKRMRLFWAKAIVIAVFSFFVGAISILLTWLISYPFLDSTNAGSLGDKEILGFVWGTGLAFAGIALLSLALGFLLRSTAGSISLVVVLLFVINIPLALAGAFWDFALKLTYFVPSQLVNAWIDPYSTVTTWGDSPAASSAQIPLTHLGAVIVFALWILVPLLGAAIVFKKRDA